MIMPDKHIKISESLLGLGSFVLEELVKPQTIDELWSAFKTAKVNGSYPATHSFENLVFAVDMLYAIGVVSQVGHNGVLSRCD